MSSSNVTTSSPGSSTRRVAIPTAISRTAAASSSSQAETSFDPMDEFVHPALNPAVDSMSGDALGESSGSAAAPLSAREKGKGKALKRSLEPESTSGDSLDSPLPKDKKRKIDESSRTGAASSSQQAEIPTDPTDESVSPALNLTLDSMSGDALGESSRTAAASSPQQAEVLTDPTDESVSPALNPAHDSMSGDALGESSRTVTASSASQAIRTTARTEMFVRPAMNRFRNPALSSRRGGSLSEISRTTTASSAPQAMRTTPLTEMFFRPAFYPVPAPSSARNFAESSRIATTSSAIQATRTTTRTEKFVRPIKRKVSILDREWLPSSRSPPFGKKRKIDPRMLSSTFGMVFYKNNLDTDDRFSKMIEKRIANMAETAENPSDFLAAGTELLKNFSPVIDDKKKTGNIFAKHSFLKANSPIRSMPRPKEQVSTRKIETTPFRTLLTPGLQSEFHRNVIDWSSTDVIACAVDDVVQFYNPKRGYAFPLGYTFRSTISVVSFNPNSRFLAVGTLNSIIHFFDVKSKKLLKTLTVHPGDGQITALAWHPVDENISVGTSRGYMFHFKRIFSEIHDVLRVKAHDDEVCVLTWRSDGSLLASGGYEGYVRVWRMESPEYPAYHKQQQSGSVLALAWCPWNPHLLAFGGGRTDTKIRVWNFKIGSLEKTFDADSQVTSLHWSKHYRELLSTHIMRNSILGTPQPKICIWEYATTKKKADLPAHEGFLLHAAINPSMEQLVTLSTDKKMKIWDIFTAQGLKSLPDESLTREQAREKFIKEAQQEVR